MVICTCKGQTINLRNLLSTFNKLISKANLSQIRFHELRHMHASLLLQQGENIKLI
ncbi:tyrosine-type recombinase/integrase [Bacillus sp. FSL M8-0166]|uniref:tyrosine-type recombinase/integrase n=1 Tax=Bacillus sp. FSL M8-0166 TaxID=2954575 RepID=UPI004046E290